MSDVPLFPDYRVQVCNNDTESWMTGTTMVRLVFRVPNDELQETLRILRRGTDDAPGHHQVSPPLRVVDQ
ncbi:Uncharacterised protein [Mycobacteroides abscessus subsp. bolletii]|uniref:hypothetical protein n=1 Tax=Mycobacteroides abscessus TaxID=36809 RepID=UPI0009A567C8|nr:hypothetical protein [Mycobacteroides abscessus]SKR94514.1 Uncharacterised protein [Mycobacteroides abscessus subsp. bolletii]SKS03007.1 Uncharacterised protein [Mycobacteroides abscessus subsp. bolletii]DAZ90132.1 TPA_asm: hypothetical protein PROPHIFVLQ01-1_45 [Mycobacterium phage prophiFVLQ01-1]